MEFNRKHRSIFLLDKGRYRTLYNEEAIASIQRMTRNDGTVYDVQTILDNPEDFADVRIVFSGWGAPALDETLLAALPALEAVFYGAGSVRNIVTDAFWERDILLTSSYQVNALPVAQYTVAAVVFALKRAFHFSTMLKAAEYVPMATRDAIPGVYRGSKVGIISLGAIGNLVCEMLRDYEVDVLAYDPYADMSAFNTLGVQRVYQLEELFAQCDVISLHAPWLKETEGLITGDLLRRMPSHATFINTARGAIVNETEMYDALSDRPDLFVMLDVLTDEESYHKHPLASLPNVFLTPHIAGSKGRESHRMGWSAVEECRRFLNNEPQLCSLNRECSKMLA